jgi:hypothetical protein
MFISFTELHELMPRHRGLQVEKRNQENVRNNSKSRGNTESHCPLSGGEEPFEQDNASRKETVGTLKSAVLAAFGLTEGQSADGGTFTYTLFNHKTPLENLNETLGQVAGDEHTLELKLSQQVKQG